METASHHQCVALRCRMHSHRRRGAAAQPCASFHTHSGPSSSFKPLHAGHASSSSSGSGASPAPAIQHQQHRHAAAPCAEFSPALSAFRQREQPWPSRALQGATVGLETAAGTAEDAMHHAAMQLCTLLQSLEAAMQQAVSGFLAWLHALGAAREAAAAAASRGALGSASTSHHAHVLAQQQGSSTASQAMALEMTAAPAAAAPSGMAGSRLYLQHQHQPPQLHCSVQAALQPLQTFSVGLPSGPLRVLGLLAALLAASALQRLWRRRREDARQRRQLEQLAEMNGVSLQRQKQRFQQALTVDSINLELPDIKDAAVDPGKSVIAVQPGSDVTRRQWESFMAASKSGQVTRENVWDAHGGHGDDGAPKASRRQLEAMTARVRAASTAGADAGKGKSYVSFDQLCGEGDDFDARMADRVAQRKARFQGQFLTDQDVGLPSAPKRPTAGGQGHLLGGGRGGSSGLAAPGAGRLGGAGSGEPSVASRRQRLGLGEGREKAASGGVERVQAAGGGGALLEIRPKRGAQQEGGGPEVAAGAAAAQQQGADPNGASATGRVSGGGNGGPAEALTRDRPQRGLQGSQAASLVSGGSGQTQQAQPSRADRRGPIGDNGNGGSVDELERSRLMRAPLEYVHPSLLAQPAASLATAAPKSAVAAGPPSTHQSAGSPAAELPGQLSPPGGINAIGPSGDGPAGGLFPDDEDAALLLAPVSGVSVGLLRGAARVRGAGAERARLGAGAGGVKQQQAAAAERDGSSGAAVPSGSVEQQQGAPVPQL